MSATQSNREKQFERMLMEVLVQDYDLAVRQPDDLNRRASDVACLSFEYRYEPDGSRAKAIVTVEGVSDFSAFLPVDFACEEAMERAAEECEPLVLFLSEHLRGVRENAFVESHVSGPDYGRREDDLSSGDLG